MKLPEIVNCKKVHFFIDLERQMKLYMKGVTSRLVGFVFCRIILCVSATVLIALILENCSFLRGSVTKWLIMLFFAAAVCMFISLTIIEHVRIITEQSVKKFSDEAAVACAKTSENLRIMAEVLNKNAYLMDEFVCMINKRDVEGNDVSEKTQKN